MSLCIILVSALVLFSAVQIPAFIAGAIIFWLGQRSGRNQKPQPKPPYEL